MARALRQMVATAATVELNCLDTASPEHWLGKEREKVEIAGSGSDWVVQTITWAGKIGRMDSSDEC